MFYRLLADLTIVAHLAFIVFVVAGAFLVARYRWLLLPHLFCAAWGVYVEAAGAVCPLTPLENRFARRAGGSGYQGSFVEHHLVPLIYPDRLTREMQWSLAGLVVAANVAGYACVLRQRRKALAA
jgi:hypothetical protein